MSKIYSYLSPQNYQKNKKIFQQYNTNFPNLEKEIFKLINYLRINPEKYFNEFNNFFLEEELETIIKEINESENKLYPFNTKKEISNSGNDYLDYLIENTSDKIDFNFKNVNKTCFNLRERLSKYGQRYGKIFESVIINSNSSEEIVNKLIKDEKARKMLLSPNMKYIAITCGFIPKWNNTCTIIDIVQNFIAYKDIDNISYNNNNDIQIINTIEFDENESSKKEKKKEMKQLNSKSKDIKNKYCSKTCKFKNKLNKKDNLFNGIENNFQKKNNENNSKENNLKYSTNTNNMERKKNYNYLFSRNDYNKKFSSTSSAYSKLVSPYKSDAYLIFNQTHSNLQKSFYSMKRVNLDAFNNNNNECDLTTKTQITMTGDNYKNNDLPINNNNNILSNTNQNYNNKTFNKIEVCLKNKKYKYNTERITGKDKIEIIHSLNVLKNNLMKEKKEKEKKINDIDINNKIRITNFTLKNIDIKKNMSRNNDNNDLPKTEIEKTDINNDIKNIEPNNYNISFDNNTYSFVSKDNQNNQNTTNENENLMLTIEQINNTSVVNPTKKQNSFFSHDTEIKNILYQKEKNINQKKLKVNKINNREQKEIKKRNKNETTNKYENISFNDENKIKINNTNKTDNISNNEEENIIENNITDSNYNNEDLYCHKNKKEIKQLIRLYNKERYEQKNKLKTNNINIASNNNINKLNINNNEGNNNTNEENNKKSTATFFYIKKENSKENINNNDEEKKIKVYRKQKVDLASSQNIINKNINNNKHIYNNYSYKNIKTKKYFFPRNILNTDTNYYKNDKNNNNINILLTENNINNITNINYNQFNEKKRIFSYKANRAKLSKNRSCGNVLLNNIYKNLEEKQYLSDQNINEREEKFTKSPKYTIKRISNVNDNIETKINSDNNNEYIDEIMKLNGYKFNQIDLKEIKINYIYNNKNNYTTYKENSIYKKNIIKPDNKNSFNFYNKALGLNKNMKLCKINKKYKINTNKISNIIQNESKKKYIISYINDTDYIQNNK